MEPFGGFFANPVFLLAAVWLAASTAACSWERTARALGLWRAARQESGDSVGPGRVLVELPESEALTTEVVCQRIESLGLNAREDDVAVVGHSGLVGLLGSPVFHWGLVGVMTFALLGQMTRSEGIIDVAEGTSVVESADAYSGSLDSGPLFPGRHTGLIIALASVEETVMVGEVNMGRSPLIQLYDDLAFVAEGLVYPNSPLKYGSLTLHRTDVGPGAMIDLTFPNGEDVDDFPILFARIEGAVQPAYAEISGPGGAKTVYFTAESGVKVAAREGSMDASATVLAEGDSMTLSDGTVLAFDRAVPYARLTVVNDWTLPWIWASCILAGLGFALTLAVPTRIVWVGMTDDGMQSVFVYCPRMDPAFPLYAKRAFGASEEESAHA